MVVISGASVRRTGLAIVWIAAVSVSPIEASRAPVPSAGARAVRCDGQVATIVGTDNADHLAGTPGVDIIAGLGGKDRIRGGDGDDVLCGGGGADRMFGGLGSDHIKAGRGYVQTVEGGYGDDYLSSLGKLLFGRGGPGDDVVVVSGEGVGLAWSYEPGNDEITTGPGSRFSLDLDESPVAAQVDLAAGIVLDGGRTTLHLGSGTTTSVRGTPESDVLRGGPGGDDITGNGGDDVLSGRGGPDYLNVQGGQATVRGGGGPDSLGFDARADVYGGDGRDRLQGHRLPGSSAVLDGGRGRNDLVLQFPYPARGLWRHVLIDLDHHRIAADGQLSRFTGVFDLLRFGTRTGHRWTINGTDAPDTLEAYPKVARHRDHNRPHVFVHGHAGDDTIVTGSGDDVIWGGRGHDSASAGAGADICHSIESQLRRGEPFGCKRDGKRAQLKRRWSAQLELNSIGVRKSDSSRSRRPRRSTPMYAGTGRTRSVQAHPSQ